MIAFIEEERSEEIQEHRRSDRVQIDIDDQTDIEIIVHAEKTVWHRLISRYHADSIQSAAQCGVYIGVLLMTLYCFCLHSFDRGDFGWISVIYSIVILLITVPGSIAYFGTINAGICYALIFNNTFWFKISNVIICNCIS